MFTSAFGSHRNDPRPSNQAPCVVKGNNPPWSTVGAQPAAMDGQVARGPVPVQSTVTDLRGGPRPGSPVTASQLAFASSLVPGGDQPQPVPAGHGLVKSLAVIDGQDVGGAGQRPGSTTSGSRTPLSAPRRVSRDSSSVAAQHATRPVNGVQRLEEKPTTRGDFPSQTLGPIGSQTPFTMRRNLAGHLDEPGSLEASLNRHAAVVEGHHLDLATAAGLPGFHSAISSAPQSVATPSNNIAEPMRDFNPNAIPSPPGSPGFGGPQIGRGTPVGAGNAVTCFGYDPNSVTL